MNQFASEKLIKELCGEQSFKRGKQYNKKGHVSLINSDEDPFVYKAVIKGIENFYVTIQKEMGKIKAECNCPKLSSFNKHCQHVAATLLFLNDTTKRDSSYQEESLPTHTSSQSSNRSKPDLLHLFSPSSIAPKNNQHYIEDRKLLKTEFILNIEDQYDMLSIRLRIGSDKLTEVNIKQFLTHYEKGQPFIVSDDFTYHNKQFFLQRETDKLIKQLLTIFKQETFYTKNVATTTHSDNSARLYLPPSSFETVLPLLIAAPSTKLVYENQHYEGVTKCTETLPISFSFDYKNGDNNFRLKIYGIEKLKFLHLYQIIFIENKLVMLKDTHFHLLAELRNMVEEHEGSHFLLSIEKLEEYTTKVIPIMKQLGKVEVSQTFSPILKGNQLKARLYLDRINHKLLAGLEFQYNDIILNPLEIDYEEQASSIVRDEEKEKRILGLLEESMLSKTEGGYFLQNEELEYQFLHNMIPQLKSFVEIFATSAVRARLFTKPVYPFFRVEVEERTNWLSIQFDINGLNEEDIRGILQSLELKRPYYKLTSGSFLSLENKEFEKVARFLEGLELNHDDLQKEIHLPILYGIQQLDKLEDKAVVKLGKKFESFLQNLRTPNQEQYGVPPNLNATLRDYQKIGFNWLKTLSKYQFGGILADDMGLGKTIQAITFILSNVSEIRHLKKPAVIVSPSSLIYNWANELKKFAPELRVMVVAGTKKERNHIFNQAGEYDVLITSYPLLVKDNNHYKDKQFHTLFLDEAQAVKNPLTQTAKSARMVVAKNRFALTGTPVENSLTELWSIFQIVFPSLFPNRKAFLHLPRGVIAKRVKPFILRREKKDVLQELPAKVENKFFSDLYPEQKQLYLAYLAKLKHDKFKHLDKETIQKNRIKILAGITRLRQICCHPSLFIDDYDGRSAKLDQLIDIIKECHSTGKRILIFSQFTKMLQLIGAEITKLDFPYFYLDGQTASAERIELCKRFNNGEREIFLISLKAGGTGLNLTGADTVILYDLWWNPAVEMQAADRAHRIGQTEVVQVIKLVTNGTIEGKMNALQERKKGLIEDIIQSSKSPSISDEDIIDLLS
ncbi:DEAD/DEAH box helicase [Metabacillus malikii]|uniref:SNF2 family DNA or RNA helicase n=1 Tax=Metabacillus malikii TaxID=1504265 RepID=A0ABT9ZDE9_9BACI|nr:DEAD/DEAH box helicase [Metabacillus malikii]MDQ0230040.1 SNF2 family DNA or RNA helicase [Metabacillus malikii]